VCEEVEHIISLINRKKKFLDAHEKVLDVEQRILGVEVLQQLPSPPKKCF